MSDPREERRLVTIMFADLSGYTSFSKDLDPEEIREAINVCFEHLNRIITRHGGMIHKYEGDLVIALYGVPDAHEDDPERAVRSALEMLAEMPEINRSLARRTGKQCDFGLHAGINTGVVFAGEIGSDQKKEYTVIGEAVNVASRLKDAAQRGEILVTERVFRQSRYLFEYQPKPAQRLKGIDEPVTLFQPLAVKQNPDPKRGIEGLSSPLVGRQADLAALEEKVRNLTAHQRGGAVFILGEAGMGKSRLCAELKGLISRDQLGVDVLEGPCLSYGAAVAYFPFTRILMQVFGIADQDGSDAIRDKIRAKVAKVLPDAGPEIVPSIAFLFSAGTAEENEKLKYLDAQSLKVQVWFGLKNLLMALARQRPLLLIVEDYHWIDAASLEFLEFMLDLPRPFPLLAVLLTRIEKDSAGYQTKEKLKKKLKESFLEIVLSPLNQESSRQLVDNILSVSGLSQEAKSHILVKAEGNPFYLEEILRSLIDRGSVIRESGVWRAVPGLSVKDVPDTVHGVIATRIDRLAPELKGLLQKASVIGRSFDAPVLELLADMDPIMLSLNLATLEEWEFVHRASFVKSDSGAEYAFKHPLIQEVAYQSLPRKYRSELHRQVAETLVRIFPHIQEEYPEILAHHYVTGDSVDQALEWLKKAGQKAMDRYANEEAIRLFEQIVSLLQTPANRTMTQTMSLAEAYEALGDLYALTGVFETAIARFGAMKELAADPVRKATALRKTANVHFKQAVYPAAFESMAEADKLIVGDGIEAQIEKAEIGVSRSVISVTAGRLDEAWQETESTLALLDRIGREERAQSIRARCLNNLAVVYRQRGEIDKAVGILQKSIEILKELDKKALMGRTINQLAILYHIKGDYTKAIELNEQSLRIMEEVGDKMWIAAIHGNLGLIYAYKGETDKALQHHQKQSAIAEAIGDKRGMGVACNNLGRIHAGRPGHETEALVSFQRALEIFEEIGDQVSICAALGNLAIIHMNHGDPGQAEKEFLRTEELLTALGNKELLVTTYNYLTLVQLAKKGPVEEAKRRAERALAFAESIGSKIGRADALGNSALVHVEAGDLEQAKKDFSQAIDIFTGMGRKSSISTYYHSFVKALREHGHAELAEHYLSEETKHAAGEK